MDMSEINWRHKTSKETREEESEPGKPDSVGLADSPNFIKCKNGLHHCVHLVELIEKYI